MKIGDLQLNTPFILAPLAGYTDLPFRLLCRKHGAGLCYSEMISSNGLVYRQKNTLDLLTTVAEERPVAMQLFGNDPVMMADAAAIVSDYPIDVIDINMGCPVKKVVKKGAGAALMKDRDLAEKIVTAVRRATTKALTVKIRTGWSHDCKNAVDFSRMVAGCGADAITVHGRTWSDGFGGRVDLATISLVKRQIDIPVIGNGDILCYQDGLDMMAKTGVDGVMIGRGALGAPWIFTANLEPVTVGGRARALAMHLQFIERFSAGSYPLARIKNHAGRYFKGVRDAASIRQHIYAAASTGELHQLVACLCEQAPAGE